MKTLLIVVLSLAVGFCVGVGVMRPSLKRLKEVRAELATKDSELAQRQAEEDLAIKELKVCTSTLHTQNDALRQNNQMMADWIRRKQKQQ